MKKVLAIVGPTAVGKTDLAIKVAKKLNGEIVSGDSMQVYQEVAIGTAKATEQEQAEVKHYLVDTRSIFEEYSVKDFVDEATLAIKKVHQKGKLPIIAGGTGFYVNALLNKMQLGEKTPEEKSVTKKWEDYLIENGPQQLWDRLNEVDSEAAAKIPVNNSRRTLRALTVIDRTGEKFSQQQNEILPRYDYKIIGLNSNRSDIYERINKRVDLMIDRGIVQEAKFIYDNREREYQVLQAIGYKEFFAYFEGEKSLAECVEDLKTASRRYAKRQLTYFRNKLPVTWFDPLQDENVVNEIIDYVSK